MRVGKGMPWLHSLYHVYLKIIIEIGRKKKNTGDSCQKSCLRMPAYVISIALLITYFPIFNYLVLH
jgi:hypothetical protein